MSLNKVNLIGKLGADPEIRTTQNGDDIANFTIATSEKWKDKSGEKQEKTEWHKIVVFSKGLASLSKNYLKKGQEVFIEGQLKTRKWTDQSGVDKYFTEVVLSNYDSKIIMLGSKQSQENKPKEKDHSVNVEDIDDEIPF